MYVIKKYNFCRQLNTVSRKDSEKLNDHKQF